MDNSTDSAAEKSPLNRRIIPKEMRSWYRKALGLRRIKLDGKSLNYESSRFPVSSSKQVFNRGWSEMKKKIARMNTLPIYIFVASLVLKRSTKHFSKLLAERQQDSGCFFMVYIISDAHNGSNFTSRHSEVTTRPSKNVCKCETDEDFMRLTDWNWLGLTLV